MNTCSVNSVLLISSTRGPLDRVARGGHRVTGNSGRMQDSEEEGLAAV